MMERYCAIIGRGRQIFGSESTGLPLRVIRCSNPVQLSQPPTRARPSDHLIDLRSRVDLDKGNHGKRSKDTQSLGALTVLKVVSRFSKKKMYDSKTVEVSWSSKTVKKNGGCKRWSADRGAAEEIEGEEIEPEARIPRIMHS